VIPSATISHVLPSECARPRIVSVTFCLPPRVLAVDDRASQGVWKAEGVRRGECAVSRESR
jgi:hypothetical protein